MKKLLTLSLLAWALCVNAQEDVTSQYVKNPSFEQDDISKLTAVNNSADGLRGYTLTNPTGWTVSGTEVTELLVSKDCYTDNNFGKVTTIPDGNHAYYLRMGWSTGTTTMKQSVKLPAGKYQFMVAQRSGYANSATSTLNLTAGTESTSIGFVQGSTGFFTSAPWITSTLDFTLDAEKTIDLGFSIEWQSGGSCVMLDNVKLYKMPDDYTEPEDPTEESVPSFTEGVITSDFVGEADMKSDLLQMLADFSQYMKNDFNSVDGTYGYFNGESSGQNNEAGVRTNADLSMICAFLVKYGKGKVTLPTNVSWSDLESMAKKSLAWAYATHKANKLRATTNNGYWGSTAKSDSQWESSLWAMSVAYSAFFQWDKLNNTQKNHIYKLLKAECNYELERDIPTGYAGDTKAEENGWEADILAATLGLYPNDELAPKWFERLREFAINSYSHPADVNNINIIDEWYNNKTYADLYKGQNLYDDYSLQNHNLFHTSYQNVVMQELGEAALALKMFQLGVNGEEKWKTNALMHNNQEVQDNILNWLALADGELAMPNGNDWSLFLYDQITSYSTQACFQKDPNALMLENMAYKYIKARQKTTNDGSWLLRPDVGARRMGVEGHRVMMTFLMHDVLPTADLTPTAWNDFNKTYGEARMIPCQNVVRAATDDRFTCFSWSDGLKSYTGYFAANSPDKNKIVVPYRANNTGNLIGWYEVSGKSTDATPVISGIYQFAGNGYVMNGELNTNAGTLNNRFALYSTPQNALIYLDYVTANNAATITAEKGGMLAISTDELMKLTRTLYYNKEEGMTHKQLDGSKFTQFESAWVNIDNELGIISVGNGKKMAFGDRGANNSIYTSKLYPMYNNASRSVKTGDVVDARNLVYYSNINAEKTKEKAAMLLSLKDQLPTGWNGVIAPDADCYYLLISNFKGETTATLKDFQIQGTVAPVFYEPTTINDSKATVTLNVQQNHSVAQPLAVLVSGSNITAQLIDDTSAYITATADATINIAIGTADLNDCSMKKGETIKAYLEDGQIKTVKAQMPKLVDVTDKYLSNADFSEGPVVTADIRGYGKDMTGNDVYSMQPVTGWTAGKSGIIDEKGYVNSAQGGGVFTYGSTNLFKGNNKGAPATNPEGEKAGNCLGIFGVWSANNCNYYQEVTLPSGTYTITVPVYNTNDGNTYASSLTGFIADNGTPYTTTVNVAAGAWQIASTTFRLAQETHGKISIGYNAANVGSAGAPHLFFDHITLTCLGEEEPEPEPEPDAIQSLQSTTGPKGIYTLQGTKIETASLQRNGIYIIDGKMTIIK